MRLINRLIVTIENLPVFASLRRGRFETMQALFQI